MAGLKGEVIMSLLYRVLTLLLLTCLLLSGCAGEGAEITAEPTLEPELTSAAVPTEAPTVTEAPVESDEPDEFGSDMPDEPMLAGDTVYTMEQTAIEIPVALFPVGLKDQDTLYCFDAREGSDADTIVEYDIHTGLITPFIETLYDGWEIFNLPRKNGNWMVWIELSRVPMTNEAEDWLIRAMNLGTNEIFTADRKDVSIEDKEAPGELSLDNGRVAYLTHDLVDDEACTVIKCLNLEDKTSEIVDWTPLRYFYESVDGVFEGFSGSPSISGDYVVCSYSHFDDNVLREYGDCYLYNLKTGEKTQISDNNQTVAPRISGDIIVARVKPDGDNLHSYLVTKRIDDPDWSVLITYEHSVFREHIHTEIGWAQFERDYLAWDDNVQSGAYIYNFSDGKLYSLALSENERKNPVFVCYVTEDCVMWRSILYDDSGDTVRDWVLIF